MELRHLRYFLAVAATGNFRKAAELQFVAQSALSQQIARLEAELGSPLFFRTTRNVSLTPAGEAFQPLAMRVVAGVEHAESELAALTGLRKGRLRLGIIQTGCALDLVRLINAFRARYVGIDLGVRSGASSDMAAAVRSGELDIAIIALPEEVLPSTFNYQAITDDPLVAVLPQDAAEGLGPNASLAEIAGRGPFIHYLPGSGLRHSVDAAFERAGVTVEATFELPQIADMIRLAALGVGVTVVPQTTAAERLLGADPQFAVVTLADPEAQHRIGVVHEEGRLTPSARVFLNMLVQERPGLGV